MSSLKKTDFESASAYFQKMDVIQRQIEPLEATVNTNKRIYEDAKTCLLFTQLLGKIGYPDRDIAFDCLYGFPLVGTLETISERAKETDFKAPAVAVFGDVVGLHVVAGGGLGGGERDEGEQGHGGLGA